jgi:hypothetical protein
LPGEMDSAVDDMREMRWPSGVVGSPPCIRAAALLVTFLALSAGVAPSARALVIESGNGLGNTSAPVDDPGFDHIGTRGVLGVTYLGNRWVLTANHVGAGDVVIGGVTYSLVPGSAVRITDATHPDTDLVVFRIFGDPGLPDLPIVTSTPALNQPVTLISPG